MTVEQHRGYTQIDLDNPDGSTTNISVHPDGTIYRTTQHVDPSTGRTITVNRDPDGTITRQSSGPNGEETTRTFPDRTVERTVSVVHEDGSTTMERYGRDGQLQARTTNSQDPDGTIRDVTERPGQPTEVRTSKSYIDTEGNSITETTGPEGIGRSFVRPGGKASGSTLQHPDGTVETTTLQEFPDGSNVLIHSYPDGTTETAREYPDEGGAERTVRTLRDGTEEHIVTRHSTLPDGSTVSEVEGPGIYYDREVIGPLGIHEREIRHADGSHEFFASSPDIGHGQTHTHTQPNGEEEVITQTFHDGVARTETVYNSPAGEKRVYETVGLDGSVHTRVVHYDHSVEETTMAPDGSGTWRLEDNNGNVVEEHALERDAARDRSGVEDADRDGAARGRRRPCAGHARARG